MLPSPEMLAPLVAMALSDDTQRAAIETAIAEWVEAKGWTAVIIDGEPPDPNSYAPALHTLGTPIHVARFLVALVAAEFGFTLDGYPDVS